MSQEVAKPECTYCGATDGLRVKSDGGGVEAPEFICETCFTATDDGPCFDDLPIAPASLLPATITVPSEPTIWMSAAGMRIIKNTPVDHFHKYAGGIANSVYAAMIEASDKTDGPEADNAVRLAEALAATGEGK